MVKKLIGCFLHSLSSWKWKSLEQASSGHVYRKPLHLALVGIVLLPLFLSQPAQAARERTEESDGAVLFTPTGVESAHLAANILRAQQVRVNFDALGSFVLGEALRERVRINLFDDVVFVAVQDSVEVNLSGSFSWIGHVEGLPYSEVTLIARDGVLIGRVLTLDGTFELRYLGDGVHEVLLLSPEAYPDTPNDAVPLPADAVVSGPSMPAVPEVASDDGSVLDLLVVYTSAARAAAGGTVAIESAIEMAVADANQTYRNSNVNQRLFLVHMEEDTTGYVETGDSGTDLDRLRILGDGYLDQVTAIGGLRDTYHADLVSMVANTGSANVCGIGYLQDPIGSFFVNYAFTWVLRTCLGAGTLSHEIGHNQAARHDWYVDSAVTPYTYAHGYVNQAAGNRWRTVMAYAQLCTDDGGGACPRLSYFSNPNVSINGYATGVTAGTSTSCAAGSTTPNPSSCDADVHQVLNNTAPAMAQYRLSSNTWIGTTSDWHTATNWSWGLTPRAFDDVTIPGAPSGGNAPIVNHDAVVRNVTLQTGASLTIDAGVLTVHGDWDEEGTGFATITGGTVVFAGSNPQSIGVNGASAFNNVVIGDGTRSQSITLNSDVDINGDLTVMDNATLSAGTHTLRIAGNWTNNGWFVAGSGTVVFDGSGLQTLAAIGEQTLMSEDFAAADGQTCCSSAYLPAGWVRDQVGGFGWLAGDYSSIGGAAWRWNDSTDAWLLTTAIKLRPGWSYRISYQYRLLSATGTDILSVWLGPAPVAAAMTNQISSVTVSNNSYLTRDDAFSVATEGWYYLGIRGQRDTGSNYLLFDNLELTASPSFFYNVEVANDAQVALSQDTVVQNNLTVAPGGLFDVGAHTLSVDGSVTNNGTLRQSLPVNAASVEFLRIQNGAATVTQYRGVVVDATVNGQNLGITAVSVRELNSGEYCTSSGSSSPLYVQRCYDITPASQPTANVSLRLYARTADELNGIPQASLALYRAAGSPPTWGELTTTAATGDDGSGYSYAQADTPGFSSFLLAATGNAPTRVQVQRMSVHTPLPTITLTASLLVLGCILIASRQRRK
ncbi:MAG: M12 family metallo-peptidase [Chloroflexota bacterium]